MQSPCLDEVLAPGGITPSFQPIVEVQGMEVRLHAVEALVRGPIGSNMERAEILFEYVRRKRQEIRVDRACVAANCEAARDLPRSVDLALNVHAVTLSRDPEFVPFLCETAETRALDPARLIVEIVERAPEWADVSLGEALGRLRRVGVRIALDDIGLGLSDCRMILECRPDYFKIDRYFVRDCHADFYRQALLDAIASLAHKVGARVVAEGVEEPAELVDLAERGIDLYQGYLFSPAVPVSELNFADLTKAGVRNLGASGVDAASTERC